MVTFEIRKNVPIPRETSYRRRTRKKPKFKSPGRFVAWIAGVDRPSKGRGVSACAWLIEKADNAEKPYRYAIASSDQGSTHVRGVIGAAEGVLEDLPEGSTVEIRTDLEFLVNVINGANIAHANLDRWESFETLRREMNLSVSACRCPNDDIQIVSVKDAARKKRDKRVAKLIADGSLSTPAK